MAFDQLLGQIFLNLSFFALSIRVTTKGRIMSNKTFVTTVFSILCYMDRREGDAAENLNIRSSRGASEYSLKK